MTASDLTGLAWRKSTRSGTTSNCIEVAFAHAVLVRDSKNAPGPTLTLPPTTWSRFLTVLN